MSPGSSHRPQTAGAPTIRLLHAAHVRWYNAEAQYALDLAGEMVRQGAEAEFLALTGSPGAARAREAGLVTHEEAGFNAKGLQAASALPAAVRLARLLRRRGIDAVEVHRPEGLPLIALACHRAGVPVIRVRGDMRPVRADPFNRFLYRRVLAGVVASNTAVEAGLRARLGPLRRLRTIHGGVDPDLFRPDGVEAPIREELALPPEALMVGILGRLGRVKGHDDFLAAARVALEAGADAAFVVLAKSPGGPEEALRARVAQDPLLRGRVRFLGHRPDLPAVLRAFDLGVIASIGSEANCRVGLEWMASEVPLLATEVGVLPDLVAEGKTGTLVSPGAPEAMGARIAALARDREGTRRWGKAARQRVLEHFTLDRCARAHLDLLEEVGVGGRQREGRG